MPFVRQSLTYAACRAGRPNAGVCLDRFHWQADTYNEKGSPDVTFSRQIVSVVSAMLLAAHVVLGCSAHHAHAKPLAGHGLGNESLAAEGHQCARHGADSGVPTDDDPCDETCGEGSCSFMSGGRIVLPELGQPTGLEVVADELRLIQLSTANHVGEIFFERQNLPHLRSHLSKCVLLV